MMVIVRRFNWKILWSTSLAPPRGDCTLACTSQNSAIGAADGHVCPGSFSYLIILDKHNKKLNLSTLIFWHGENSSLPIASICPYSSAQAMTLLVWTVKETTCYGMQLTSSTHNFSRAVTRLLGLCSLTMTTAHSLSCHEWSCGKISIWGGRDRGCGLRYWQCWWPVFLIVWCFLLYNGHFWGLCIFEYCPVVERCRWYGFISKVVFVAIVK